MNATEVIETYVGDTVRFLPGGQRGDVAAELRSLLTEELQAQARETGRPADDALALSLVRGYGRPNEAAARYQTPWAVIDPADTAGFLRASAVGAGALVLLGVLSKRLPPLPGTTAGLVKVGILIWLGILVVAFGAKGWVRRRWPATAPWEPLDRDRANRAGTAVVVPVAACLTVMFAAPGWAFGQITGGQLDTSWAAYTGEFQRTRLPLFVGLMAGLIGLRAYVAVRGRWSRMTRRIDIGLNLALACLILSAAVDGHIFQAGQVDHIARNVLALVGGITIPCVGVQVYGEIGRVDRVSAKSKAYEELPSGV